MYCNFLMSFSFFDLYFTTSLSFLSFLTLPFSPPPLFSPSFSSLFLFPQARGLSGDVGGVPEMIEVGRPRARLKY